MFTSPVEPQLAAACKKLKLVKVEAAGWMAAIADRGVAAGAPMRDIEREVREHASFATALTTKGMADPADALFRTLHLAMNDNSRANVLARAKQTGWSVHILAPNDPGTCDPAKALDHKEFSPDDAPTLPLAGCPKSICRCGYNFAQPNDVDLRAVIAGTSQRPR